MTRRQAAQYDAVLVVQAFLDAHAAEVGALPPFAAAKAQLDALVAELETALRQQAARTAGARDGKRAAREALSARVLQLSAAAGALALLRGEAVLGEQVTLSRSALDDLGDDAFSGRVLWVLDGVAALADDLVPYGIGAAERAAAEAAFRTWRRVRGSVRAAALERADGTARIGRLLPQIQALLSDVLDRLVTVAAAQRPELGMGWKGVREIVDPPTRTRALTVAVVEPDDAEPISVAGALARIEPGGVAKVTALHGRFHVQSLAPGAYTLVVEKAGYRPVAPVAFAVAAGEMTRLTVVLERDAADD